jgi:site-specific recombinase XerD
MDEQLPLFSTSPAARAEPKTTPPAAASQAVGAGSSLSAAILAWREHLEKERSPANTVKAFIGDLNLAAQFIGAFKSIGQVSTRDLDNWLEWQRSSRKCSPKTYARRVTSLKSFFRWLHQHGVLGSDPAATLVQQSVLSPLPEILSEAEIETVLAAAESLRHADTDAKRPDPRPYVLFTLLLNTGLKKGECLALVPNHVDLSNPAEPVLWVRYPDPRQRYKERKLRLDRAWIPAYKAYMAQYEPRDKLFPWSPRRLEYLLEDLSKAAALRKHLSFDMCRWTCAVRDMRAGMDENQVRQKMGLSKIQWREIKMKLDKLVERA